MIEPEAAGSARVAPADPFAGFDAEERVRYARHFALDRVGPEGQRRLRDARVLLVGAGGLGSPAALYLAAAGVGTLGIVDDDAVDRSNLQRQILHGTADVGRPKTESARERLRAVNPGVRVEAHRTRLTSANALGLVDRYDLTLDGSDNFPTRYLVNDASVLLGRPWVYGAVLRWEGQCSLFGAPEGPCYRCLFREPPPPGMVPGCAEAGVVGVLPGIVGSLQALEVVKWILGEGEPLTGRLVLFDALALRFREIAIRRDPECPVCGDAPTIRELVDVEWFCATGETRPAGEGDAGDVREWTPVELEAELGGEVPPLLVDVREAAEWEVSNLGGRGAVHIPMLELEARVGELPATSDVVLYCRSGARSGRMARVLRAAGHARIGHLAGGLQRWAGELNPDLPVA